MFMPDFFLCACMRPNSATVLLIAPLNAAVKKEKVECHPMKIIES